MKNRFPSVPSRLPSKDKIPSGYRLCPHKWSFGPDRIGETVMVGGVQTKKLLTLDLNIPDSDFEAKVNRTPLEDARQAFIQNYPCPHRCPGCFNNAKLHNPILTFNEVREIVVQAQELGLESIKFLGPGELLANLALFQILDEFARRNIVVGIFTKGAIMGNDMLSRHYHGIDSAELVRRLVAYPNVTFLVGARSFDPHLENIAVPRNKREIKEEFDYHKARNIAIERLCRAGMNADLFKQRLAIICSPVTAQNIDGASEIFRWGAERNMPVYIPPTMVSGKGHRLVRTSNIKKFEQNYIDMAVEVYTWLIERGVMSLGQLERDGVHPYIGLTPCNQLTHGMYIHYDGEVWRCPGNDTPDFVIHQNVRDTPLAEIWRNSKNYSVNQFNNGCVKDGVVIPMRFYTEVLRRVSKSVK